MLVHMESPSDHDAIRSLIVRAFAGRPFSDGSESQRCGVGTRLIEAGLRGLRSRGANGCALVGDHRYYRRFGFSLAPELAPPGYPTEHFQLLAFGPSRPTVRVVFHPAFSVAPS